MSTKCSLAYGDGFHLYSEVMESTGVYLELYGNDACQPFFEATSRSVMVRIPLEVWEVIRRKTILDQTYADKTDEELTEEVTAEIRARIEQYNKATTDREKAMAGLPGFLHYGEPTRPEAEQVADGVAYLKQVRENQRRMRAKIAELQSKQRR